MEKKVCKKCGVELPDKYKGKYCRDCKKKRKRTIRLVKFAVTTTAVVAAGVYTWNKQPQYVKDFLIAASKDKSGKAKELILKKADLLQQRGMALLKESDDLKKKANIKCPLRRILNV